MATVCQSPVQWALFVWLLMVKLGEGEDLFPPIGSSLDCLLFLIHCPVNQPIDLFPKRVFNVGKPNLSVSAKDPIGNTVKLDVYMEAQCPDTSRFIHKQLMKAWEKLGSSGRVEWTLVPFGKARCTEKSGDFECQCQHGASECILNQMMNCVIDKVVYPEKFISIINCIQGERSLDSAMSKCITAKEGLDQQALRDCSTGPKGRRLLALAGARTVALRPSLNFVPWIVIDGTRNADALYDLTENLCKSLQPAPEGCAEYSK